MKVVPFASGHLDLMEDFGQQEEVVRPFVGELKRLRYEDLGPCFSGFVGDRVVGCAGLFERSPYRAIVWAIIGRQDMKTRFVAIHRAVEQFLAEQKYKRIEAHVAEDDTVGHRWALMLGFEYHTPQPYYLPDGGHAVEYVRWG